MSQCVFTHFYNVSIKFDCKDTIILRKYKENEVIFSLEGQKNNLIFDFVSSGGSLIAIPLPRYGVEEEEQTVGDIHLAHARIEIQGY